ncbi:MAG: hypothetical protein GY725_10895 [bacterium]|nr:hypothetical protein [bacterium]
MTTRKHEISEDLLTLEEVALLVDGGDQVPPETARHLGPVIRTDPRFSKHVEIAEAMARDAAIKRGTDDRLADGVSANADFDRLTACDEWSDPAEILDPSGERGIPFAPLIHIAQARLQQTEDRNQLQAVLEKLRRAEFFDKLRQEVAQLNTELEVLDRPTTRLLDSTLKKIEVLLSRFRQAAQELNS